MELILFIRSFHSLFFFLFISALSPVLLHTSPAAWMALLSVYSSALSNLLSDLFPYSRFGISTIRYIVFVLQKLLPNSGEILDTFHQEISQLQIPCYLTIAIVNIKCIFIHLQFVGKTSITLCNLECI